MFTQEDIKQIESSGLEVCKVETYLDNFRRGFPFVTLSSPATVGNGIIRIDENTRHRFVELYEQVSRQKKVIKFVPASGAASRMFKHLFDCRDKLKDTTAEFEELFTDVRLKPVSDFFQHLPDFAFYEDLIRIAGPTEGYSSSAAIKILDALLNNDGLDYGSLPKGLIKFHRHQDQPARTALEEHLAEAALYASDRQGNALVHFTVSPEHLEKFRERIEAVRQYYEKRFGVKFDIAYSVQKTNTDVIAADMNNAPFRDSQGRLVFRPGGHGALIENLNDLAGDLIFIKNIDNVVPDRLKDATVIYKKILGGLLLETQQEVFGMLTSLENDDLTGSKIVEMSEYCRQNLFIAFVPDFHTLEKAEQVSMLKKALNRPVRVCGMVKNTGEPGGGPFWVRKPDGTVSLQIVESSQVNIEDKSQREIFSRSTHFNPVDLVCSTRNHRGEPYNLPDYVDHDTGFISIKSKDGRELKAQELPGLWNGAMADWITLFVEVPLITFNPVKTVNDLLRPEHQP